eukprot:PhM_4_TR18632/c0_g1_i4/m.80023
MQSPLPAVSVENVIASFVRRGVNPNKGYNILCDMNSVADMSESSFYVAYWEAVQSICRGQVHKLKAAAEHCKGCGVVTLDAGTSQTLGVHILVMKLIAPSGQMMLPPYVSKSAPGSSFSAATMLTGMNTILKEIGWTPSDIVKIMADNDSKNLLLCDVIEDALDSSTMDDEALEASGFMCVVRDDLPLIRPDIYAFGRDRTSVLKLGTERLHGPCLAHILKNTISTCIRMSPDKHRYCACAYCCS